MPREIISVRHKKSGKLAADHVDLHGSEKSTRSVCSFALSLGDLIGVYPRKSAANNFPPLATRCFPRFHVPRFVYRSVGIDKEETYQPDNKEDDQG